MKIVSHLKQHFQVSDKGPLNWFLEIEFIRTDRVFKLSQQWYMEQILTRFNMMNCRTITTPIDTSLHLYKAEPTEPVIDKTLYQQLMGYLQYPITGTHPDLAFSVSFLSQICDYPLEQHHLAAKWILHYLSGTKALSL